MKNFILIFLSFFLVSTTYAKHQNEEYGFSFFWNYEAKGSNNYYQFQSNLVKDKAVIKDSSLSFSS